MTCPKTHDRVYQVKACHVLLAMACPLRALRRLLRRCQGAYRLIASFPVFALGFWQSDRSCLVGRNRNSERAVVKTFRMQRLQNSMVVNIGKAKLLLPAILARPMSSNNHSRTPDV
jgi:hypothetical protein